MKWDFDNDRPIYQQIVEQLEKAVVSGDYKPGEKLPSVRELASAAGVNPNTMQRAMAELESRGLVVTQRTSGRSVTEDGAAIDEKRSGIAEEHTNVYIAAMKTLGYAKEETLKLVRGKLE